MGLRCRIECSVKASVVVMKGMWKTLAERLERKVRVSFWGCMSFG